MRHKEKNSQKDEDEKDGERGRKEIKRSRRERRTACIRGMRMGRVFVNWTVYRSKLVNRAL